MEQRVGFCTTADGIRIAYATVGSGPPLVFARYAPSHLEVEWQEPRIRDFWETIGRHHLVVRYDKHGSGLSDRNRTDFSFDSEPRTIEAIGKELGLKSFVLWGDGVQGAAAAIAYVVDFPARVSRLILSGAQARWHGASGLGGVSQETFGALALSNYRMALFAHLEDQLGSTFDVSALQTYLRIYQEGMTAPELLNQLAQLLDTDVRNLLPKISVPTLVIHYRHDRFIPFEAGRELAAGIPGARFVPLEGDAHLFYFGDTRLLLRAIAEFLGDPIEDVGQPAPDSAKVQSASQPAPGIFRREGEYWSIACWGEVFRLKEVRGLVYISCLLSHPREEFHVLSLASSVGTQSMVDELAKPTTEEQAAHSELTVGRLGDAGEMLNAQAKAAYKRRTAELREQLAEARERSQPDLADRLEGELETLNRELARAVGLGGRDRRVASASERARINVTRAIKVALERIAEHDPVLAALLTKSIRTGTFCSYAPDSRLPPVWNF